MVCFHRLPVLTRVNDPNVPVHYSGVMCDGSEEHLADCTLEEVTVGTTCDNLHDNDVAIVCRGSCVLIP